MADEMINMSPGEMLNEVDKAIEAILVGGQSYKIGSRMMNRADLGELRKMRQELQVEASSAQNSSLLDNTFVAYFGGR